MHLSATPRLEHRSWLRCTGSKMWYPYPSVPLPTIHPKVIFHRSRSIVETYTTSGFLRSYLASLLCLIKLLVQQMQQKIHVQLEVPLEQRHELVALKLRLQKIINGDQSAGAGDLDVAT